MIIMDHGAVKIGIDTNDEEKLLISLNNSFPKRYIPSYNLSRNGYRELDVYIEWRKGSNKFKLLDYRLDRETDYYVIESPYPQPYTCESPVFFILQVLSRSYLKKGYIIFTDSVSINIGGKTILLLGYPHSGKSTLTALAIAYKDTPLSTENTVLKIKDNGIGVVNGTSILIYDPRIEELYNIKIGYEDVTKHGYRIIDLDKHVPNRRKLLEKETIVENIYILHCSYRSGETDLETIKGRKIKKTIWYFASALLKGIDYYEPGPLHLLDNILENKLRTVVKHIGELYNGKIYEIYGRHDNVYNYIKKRLIENN